MRPLVLCFALLFASLLSSPARAEEAPAPATPVTDLVHLRYYRSWPGCSEVAAPGFYRGEVALVMPGFFLNWRGPSGRLCRVPWRHLVSVRGRAFGGPLDPAVPTEVYYPPSRSLGNDPTRLVQVTMNEEERRRMLTPGPGLLPLRVHADGPPVSVTVAAQRGYQVDQFERKALVLGTTVCQTPCTLYQPPGTVPLLFFGNGSVPHIVAAELAGEGRDLSLSASSTARLFSGQVLAIGGALATVIGAALLGTSTALTSPSLEGAQRGTRIGGGLVLGLGVAALIPGAILWHKGRPRWRVS